MLHYREMGTKLNSGNWVDLSKKVLNTAIYTHSFLINLMYLKLMYVNCGLR